jgi:TonB family protein
MKKGVLVIVVAALVGIQASAQKMKGYRTETTLKEKESKLELKRAGIREERTIELSKRSKTEPINIVNTNSEIQPAYIGGEQAMNKYLHSNLVYPEYALEHRMEGTVFVDFTIQANGRVSDVYVIDVPGEATINQSLLDEAVRVIIGMPNWIPGSQDGKKVDVKYNLPITFKIG